MNEVVPIRIPKEVLGKIELLVRLGKYTNKSEANDIFPDVHVLVGSPCVNVPHYYVLLINAHVYRT